MIFILEAVLAGKSTLARTLAREVESDKESEITGTFGQVVSEIL